MDIQQYIAADKELLLNLNGSQSLFWDGFMWVATSTIVWVPVAAMLLYIIIKNNKIQEALLTIIMIALVITKDIDLIGSVTAEVIERSQSFVYAIPEHTPLKTFNDIKKVAFVTNFDQRDLIAFDSLINVFKSFHFAVSFVHLSTDNDAWHEIKLAGIKDYFQKQYSKLELHYNVVKEDNILSNLDKYVKEENIDVICITNYKRNIFARLFNPSIARKMIFHANTPILVIK